MAATLAATTPKTASRATVDTQTAATTSETTNQAVTGALRRSVAQQTELRNDEQMRASERVPQPTERLCRPYHPQRQSRKSPTPPSFPQLVPLSPVPHFEPPNATATSYSMNPAPPLLLPSERDPVLGRRRHTLPGPSVTPPARPSAPRYAP
jgi:hypothetical protein